MSPKKTKELLAGAAILLGGVLLYKRVKASSSSVEPAPAPASNPEPLAPAPSSDVNSSVESAVSDVNALFATSELFA